MPVGNSAPNIYNNINMAPPGQGGAMPPGGMLPPHNMPRLPDMHPPPGMAPSTMAPPNFGMPDVVAGPPGSTSHHSATFDPHSHSHPHPHLHSHSHSRPHPHTLCGL